MHVVKCRVRRKAAHEIVHVIAANTYSNLKVEAFASRGDQ
jgi:hypothetical protein